MKIIPKFSWLFIFVLLASCNVIYESKLQVNLYESNEDPGSITAKLKKQNLIYLMKKFSVQNGFECTEDDNALYDFDCYNDRYNIKFTIIFGNSEAFIWLVRQHAGPFSEPKKFTETKHDLYELLNAHYRDDQIIIIE